MDLAETAQAREEGRQAASALADGLRAGLASLDAAMARLSVSVAAALREYPEAR